jgi:predicted O-linked N-acetylglucosamine transferase (SPINDLY family)
MSAAPTSDDLERARALYDAGCIADAGRAYQAVLQAAPRHAEALWRLGDVANRMGLPDKALGLVRSGIAIAPDDPQAWNCLGTVHAASGRHEEAAKAFAHAIALQPTYIVPLSNLGKVYVHLGRAAEAAVAHRHCIHAEPAGADHHANLGTALLATGQPDAALESFRNALILAPVHAGAQLGIGLAHVARGEPEAAASAFTEAVRVHPGIAETHHNLGLALFGCGRIEDAVDAFRAALAIDPGNAKAHANLIFALDLDPRAGLEETAAERRRWASAHAAPGPVAQHGNDRDPERRLRVGYVSGDLKAHSAAEALAPLILGHSAAFDVVCYSEVRKPDAMTQRFRNGAALWRESWRLDDDALAAQIRADRIDILVDLSGFSEGNRLAVFARKPAPVQVQGFGYPLGSGMAQIDHLISDLVLIPARDRHLFVEKIHDLPCCMPFALPADGPEPAAPPCDANGYVTFGSMNRFAKINARVVAVWARILARLPDARLLAKDPAFDSEDVRAWFVGRFTAHGVAPERIALRGRTARREHLAAYGEIDVALDPFPQSGGITTFETLWMGVPLLTLAGRSPQGRASASILAAAGIDATTAHSEDEYVERAVRCAGNRDSLRAMRSGLRDRLRRSAPCDRAAYSAAVEAAYRGFWRDWCAARPA